jgi:hypothetical protein
MEETVEVVTVEIMEPQAQSMRSAGQAGGE